MLIFKSEFILGCSEFAARFYTNRKSSKLQKCIPLSKNSFTGHTYLFHEEKNKSRIKKGKKLKLHIKCILTTKSHIKLLVFSMTIDIKEKVCILESFVNLLILMFFILHNIQRILKTHFTHF